MKVYLLVDCNTATRKVVSVFTTDGEVGGDQTFSDSVIGKARIQGYDIVEYDSTVLPEFFGDLSREMSWGNYIQEAIQKDNSQKK